MRLTKSDLELEVLFNRIQRKEIDLQPDFQRGEVWDRARQTRLIDTIFRRWYVPAIHIVREEDEREYVLDGQQRLRTINSFFLNEIKVVGDLEPHSEELISLHGKRYNDLPAEFQRRFQRFEITVVTLRDFDPAEPSELFFRLNQQYALTPPEKRNALFGKARDQVKSLVSELVESGVLDRTKIGFSNGRLAYDDVIARVCLAIQEDTLRRQISNNYVEQFYRHDAFSPTTLDKVRMAGEILGHALDIRGRFKLNKATLFSWLIFAYSQAAKSPEELAAFIGEFEASGSDQSLFSETNIQGLLAAYNDRASYRVLDVASVTIRDLVLHVIYSGLMRPNDSRSDLLDLFRRTTTGFQEESIEQILLSFAEAARWGETIETFWNS